MFGMIHTAIPGIRPGMPPEEAKVLMATPQFQAALKSMRQYPVTVKPDGTLSAEDVVPGTYQLEVSVMPGPGIPRPVASPSAIGWLPFVVPEGSPTDQGLDLGEVPLTVPPKQ